MSGVECSKHRGEFRRKIPREKGVVYAGVCVKCHAARQTVRYKTITDGLQVGQLQMVTVPARAIDEPIVITDINIRIEAVQAELDAEAKAAR